MIGAKQMAKKPNKYSAPFAIAGITIGMLAIVRKFVFAKEKEQSKTAEKDSHLKEKQGASKFK